MNLNRMRGVAVGVALLFILGGCSQQPQVVEVQGVVRMNGEPLEDIHVEFWPDSGRRSWGTTDKTGTFRLVTDANQNSRAGVFPGMNKVSLRDTAHTKDDYLDDGGDWVDMSNGRKSRIHSKYADALNSPLSVEVKPGQVNKFEFDVEPRPE
jgi:hypothetical protein